MDRLFSGLTNILNWFISNLPIIGGIITVVVAMGILIKWQYSSDRDEVNIKSRIIKTVIIGGAITLASPLVQWFMAFFQ